MVVVPSAMAPNNNDRCEIDLSPGTLTFPTRVPPSGSARGEDWLLLVLKAAWSGVARSYWATPLIFSSS